MTLTRPANTYPTHRVRFDEECDCWRIWQRDDSLVDEGACYIKLGWMRFASREAADGYVANHGLPAQFRRKRKDKAKAA
jgi:hypothetical protein